MARKKKDEQLELDLKIDDEKTSPEEAKSTHELVFFDENENVLGVQRSDKPFSDSYKKKAEASVASTFDRKVRAAAR